jgi:hypothetical protein
MLIFRDEVQMKTEHSYCFKVLGKIEYGLHLAAGLLCL